jgi:hypothetical protein
MAHQAAVSWIRIKAKSHPMNSTLQNILFVAVASLLLVACSEDKTADAPPQKWHNMEVRIESRPSPPRAGMNEFLVMVTDERGRPTYNLVVSLRTDGQDSWKQAIEDGQMGVYRRAVKVELGVRSVLQVQIKSQGTEDVLYFPLMLQP